MKIWVVLELFFYDFSCTAIIFDKEIVWWYSIISPSVPVCFCFGHFVSRAGIIWLRALFGYQDSCGTLTVVCGSSVLSVKIFNLSSLSKILSIFWVITFFTSVTWLFSVDIKLSTWFVLYFIYRETSEIYCNTLYKSEQRCQRDISLVFQNQLNLKLSYLKLAEKKKGEWWEREYINVFNQQCSEVFFKFILLICTDFLKEQFRLPWCLRL